MVLLAVLLTFAAIHSARASPSGNRKESVASVTASSGRAQGVFTNPAYAVHHDTVANAEAFVADGAGNSWETAGGAATEAKHVADAVGKNLRRLLRLTNHAAVVRSYRNMMVGLPHFCTAPGPVLLVVTQLACFF